MGTRSAVKQQPAPGHPLASPAVVGLDAGRERAYRRHQRKRAKNAVVRVIGFALALGVVGGAGYIAYQAWLGEEGWSTDGNEQQYTDEELENLIVELQEKPAWNGPGNPTFGVGEAPVPEP